RPSASGAFGNGMEQAEPLGPLAWQLLDLDVLECDLEVVLLEADVAFLGHAIAGPLAEFAFRDELFPGVTPELVLDDLLAIQPMPAVRTAHDDAGGIPLTRRFAQLLRWRDEIVVGAALVGWAILSVWMAVVIQQLILGRRVVDRVVIFLDAVEEDAA